MAEYVVRSGDYGVEPWTMTAGQVDIVRFTDNVDRIEVVSNGAAEVRVTNGGTRPTLGTAGASTKSLRLPSGLAGVRDLPMPQDNDVVMLVASGPAEVSVQVSM